MTMMTPMGQGGRMYPRRRRWPKVLFVFVVVAAVAAGIGFGVWRWLDGPTAGDEPNAKPSPSCPTSQAKLPKSVPPPNQVSVDVNNGTDESGLAIGTADDLTTRGFDVQGIGNTDKPVTSGTAIVRYGKKDLGAAIRVAAYVQGTKLVAVKRSGNGTVALWLGPGFDGVLSSGDADIENVELPVLASRCGKSAT